MPAEQGRPFFDSNTLLYLISEDAEKARRVEFHLYDRGCISVQVLNEFTNVARRKHGLAIAQIRPLLHELRQAIDVVPVTIAIHELGLTLAERYRLSTYDAMIAAAALDSGCSVLLSEDLHHGLKIEKSLEIRNPFA
jgi:predicted nucleic acid-binding protein